MPADWLSHSACTVVFTGAGMSTESGLPDFRSAGQGLWKTADPALLASTYALQHNRQGFVEFYRMRMEGLQTCHPHKGHEILARWERAGLVQRLVTQNVDGFHQRAGSSDVIELHGTLTRVHFSSCRTSYPSSRYLEPDGTVCACGGFLRPSVVLFGEALPEEALWKAEQAALEADLFIVLGSSLQVSPANYFPRLAKQKGAKLVIVNREPTDCDKWADLIVRDKPIGQYLQELDDQVKEMR